MELLVVRHAHAGDREAYAATGKPDTERPLSKKGREQMSHVAPALRALVTECDVVASSPLVRAVQTAEFLREEYRLESVAITDALSPEAEPGRFLDWVATLHRIATLAIVGHEPHLGTLVSFLARRGGGDGVELQKAGACLLQFGGPPARGEGALRWLKGPKQLTVAPER